mgnify:CR=1 FL=1
MRVPHYTEIRVRRWRLWPKVQLGFLFDMYAWFLIWDEFGIGLSELKDDAANKILYCAAVSAARAEGRKVWFTEKDVRRFIEQSTTKESNQLTQTLIKSQKVVTEFAEKAKGSKKK